MRIIALSDTHGLHNQIDVPDGDVIIFAGDITERGTLTQLASFTAWLEKLPHKHKIVVAGNHDFCFEKDRGQAEGFLLGAKYLQDSFAIVNGIKIYGTPWTPDFYNWAFMRPRGEELARKYNRIPGDTDILITHGPPHGILDHIKWHDLSKGKTIEDNVGSAELRDKIKSLSLKAHAFGHIHNQYGNSGIFYNVSICNEKYQPVNPPTIIDL